MDEYHFCDLYETRADFIQIYFDQKTSFLKCNLYEINK
jgi:hypothetical protein